MMRTTPDIDNSSERRFKEILDQKAREDLKESIIHGSIKIDEGKISIPMPRIDRPKFVLSSPIQEGVGQGEGEIGDIIEEAKEGEDEEDEGTGKEGEGEHEYQIEISEYLRVLQEELQLPRIKPKEKGDILEKHVGYTSNRRSGAPLNRRQTFKQSLLETIARGEYDPEKPLVNVRRENKRYIAPKIKFKRANQAVVFYMMDVSSSVTDEIRVKAKKIISTIDLWLRDNFQGVESKYIVHDSRAWEVDRKKFYEIRSYGATFVASAYKLVQEAIYTRFPWQNWNIYTFHVTDGDVWVSYYRWLDPTAMDQGEDDVTTTAKIMEEHLLPHINQVASIQIPGPYGGGRLNEELEEYFTKGRQMPENLVLTDVENDEDIMKAVRECLKGGR